MQYQTKKSKLKFKKIIRDEDFYPILSEEESNNEKWILNTIKSRSENAMKKARLIDFCSTMLRNNKDFVLKAVENNIFTIFHLPRELQKDEEVVLMFWANLIFNKKELLFEIPYVQEYMEREEKEFDEKSILYLFYGHEKRNNKEHILKLVQAITKIRPIINYGSNAIYENIYHYIGHHLKNDIKFINKLIKTDYRFYHYIKESFKEDPDIVYHMVINVRKFNLLPEDLKQNIEFIFMVLDTGKVELSKYDLPLHLQEEAGNNNINEFLQKKRLKESMEKSLPFHMNTPKNKI